MKISPKQVAIAILCIIIAFIPTYIAITYYFIKDSAPADGYYTVSIHDEKGGDVSTAGIKSNDLADIVLKMNEKMYATGASLSEDELPEKYYDITVSSEESSLECRYYFSLNDGEKTIVHDSRGEFYYLDFNDAKPFLSTSCAQSLYESSKLPTLAIFGGDDIIPTEAEWKYRTVSGTTLSASGIEINESASIHAMNSTTKLSFSIAPDRCSVKVSQNGKVIAEGEGLSCIPYDKLSEGALSFEIFAEWNSSAEFSGYAKYRFTSTVGLAPEFFINKTSIQSGEFVLVYAKNVSAPQKIEFSSSPSINYTPVFFEENGIVYALIPIDKNLEAPQKYTFRFTYGEVTSQATVNVTQRDIKDRDYDCTGISVNRNPSTLNEYHQLLSEIGLKYETTRYFSDKFIDYSLEHTSDIATIVLGYGHRRIPSNGDTPFRLDGVDYFIASGTGVSAIASGKVVYVGESDLLGKFVVIDHGLGLKTWYCNLDETLTTVGTTVVKGDTIGKPGSTGYKNTSGVYLITTIMNVPVCPYSLQEDGLTLPR